MKRYNSREAVKYLADHGVKVYGWYWTLSITGGAICSDFSEEELDHYIESVKAC